MIKSKIEQWFKCNECEKEDRVIHTDTIKELKQPDGWFKMGIGSHFCSGECYLKAFERMTEEKRNLIIEEINNKKNESIKS